MKKSVKILFLLVLIMMVVFTLSTKVNAADTINYDDYPEIEGDNGKNDEEKKDDNSATKVETNKNNENTNKTETEKKANQATEQHPQTGDFTSATCLVIGGITVVGVIVGYVKMKKYNY